MTKEDLQGTLEHNKQRMIERSVSKTKSDVALQAHSTKDRNNKGKCYGNKCRGGYNNSNGRSYQQERSSLNQRQPINQSSHRGGAASRGRGYGMKPDKIHVQCYNYYKYGHYENECHASNKNNQEVMQGLQNKMRKTSYLWCQ